MHRNMTNSELAELLRSVAAAYELKPQGTFNRFKIIAYQRAADAIERSSGEVKDLWDEGKLSEIPGIGPAIAGYLKELFETGRVRHFQSVFSNLPPALFSLLQVPGIGAKTAFKLTKELGIKKEKEVIKKLTQAALLGKIRRIPGFGKESETVILQNLEEFKGRTNRILLPYALQTADAIVSYLRQNPKVVKVDPLGSLRRQVSTVGDVDIAVASADPKSVISYFTKFPKKSRILEAGEHTASILIGTTQVDLMVQPPEAYGALLQHFTGSKHHNIALREFSLKKGMSLSEYGIKIGGKLKKFESEEKFYEALGLEWIPPELREDNGEIEAAQRSAQGKLSGLPTLVELADIKGDFHLHSNFPIKTSHDEGSVSFVQMIELADELNYEYLGFSEHNPAQSANTSKQMIDLIKRKNEAIEKFNYSRENKREKRVRKIFNGLEVDILPSGKLPIPESAFEYLDYTIVSIHSSFRLNKKEQTERVIEGLSHPKAKIFGHPTARRLNKREGIELDWEEIFDFCQKNNKWLEINSWFDRLDLPDNLVREAIKYGVKMVINTDAHELSHMNLMRYGISVARRGWAEKKDIVNTLGFDKLKQLL